MAGRLIYGTGHGIMNGKEFREAIRKGQRLYGTVIVSTSPVWINVVKDIGLDFIFIDTEHIPIDRETLSWMCQAYKGVDLPCLVRITSPDHYEATTALDGSASGIVVPYLETVDQAKKLAGATKFRPLRGLKLDHILKDSIIESEDLDNYIKKKNEDNIFLANIESVPALEALDDILEIEELDGVLVGPHDLTCSLGIPEQYNRPEFEEAVLEIIKKAREKGKGAGVHMFYPDCYEQELKFIKAGANLILHWGDFIAFRLKMKEDINYFKKTLGDMS